MNRPTLLRLRALLFSGAFLLLANPALRAGSATWNLNPGSSDWNTPTNWTPATVPNGPADSATFGSSNLTAITASSDIELDGMLFLPGASAYTFALGRSVHFTFSGTGIINNSGQSQAFHPHQLIFSNGAGAGSQCVITGDADFTDDSSAGEATFQVVESSIQFFDSSTADHATFLNGGFAQRPETLNTIDFFDESSAGNGYFVNNGTSATHLENFGYCTIHTGATAGAATFISNASPVEDGSPGSTQIDGLAGNGTFVANGATLAGPLGGLVIIHGDPGTGSYTANGGINGGNGGKLFFTPTDASGAHCIVNGNGTLDLTVTPFPGLTLGSLEGDGVVLIATSSYGARTLTVGTTNLNTTFAGTILDGSESKPPPGSLIKAGTGVLTLAGANTYSGGTTVKAGTLLVATLGGSGTGSGAVLVDGGTLGGGGVIAGAVTVGTNFGLGSFLAPSKGAKKPTTLTIQDSLILNDDSTYIYKLETKRAVSDEVIANAVAINGGARFSLRPSGTTALTLGQVFMVIDNTADSPIFGTFHNLANGKIIILNGSKLQASYTGGNGNDLTLTVVP